MEKYEVLEPVGKGSFGAVTKIRRKSDGKILVWKEINYGKMREKEKQQLVSEVNILRELRHPHIVKYYDRIIDKPNSKIFIVMEYCERGDIGLLIKKCKRENDFLSEDVIWKIFMQVLQALQACHSRESGKILHRDIKPGNVLLDCNMNVKLGDFGLSRILGENSIYAETRVGTPYYMSPEQIADARYDERSDIWSAGCLLFEMASLNPPFQAKSHTELAFKINLGQVERIPLRYSEELQRVVSWMLAIDYNRRPSVQEILGLPQIGLRVKEKEARDETQRVKEVGERLQQREDKARSEREELGRREEELLSRERKARENRRDKENCRGNCGGNREKGRDEGGYEYEYEEEKRCGDRNQGKGREIEAGRERACEVPNCNGVRDTHGDTRMEAEKNSNNKDRTGENQRVERKAESRDNYYVPERRPEYNSFEQETKGKKETSVESRRDNPDRDLKKEKTYDGYGFDRERLLEAKKISEKEPEKFIRKEKSFENLVQEGLERAKRDNYLLKPTEKKISEIPVPRPITRESPSRIAHNNSAPDIPRSRVSPSTTLLRGPPTTTSIPRDTYYKYHTPESAPDRIFPVFKEDIPRKYENHRADYPAYREIEQRHQNPPSNPRSRNSSEGADKRESLIPRFSRENSLEKKVNLRDSPLHTHDSPTPAFLERKARESPITRYSPTSALDRREPAGVDRRESPAAPREKNAIDQKYPVSPMVPKYSPGYRAQEGRENHTKVSPNFRRDPEHRRESPRYAEPVRKQSSRGGQYNEGYRKESPIVRVDYAKRNANESPGLQGLERNTSAERKLAMQKFTNSPAGGTTSYEYYKNSPTVRPIPRPRTMEGQARESPRRNEEKGSPHTFEKNWKYHGQGENKRAKENIMVKPPARRNK